MKYFLHEITDSYFGANLPAKPTGHINCVQGRDFDTSGVFYGNELQYVDESALRYTRFLEKGDVLFSSKGKLYATVWQEQVKNVVATSTFLIIKIKTPTILPEYLAMYLNSYKARRYYDLHVKTTTVFHIEKNKWI